MTLRDAISVNVITMIGIGPLITIPLVLAKLHGPLALAGWIVGALVAVCDGLVWAELGSRHPGSGGSYVYLRDAFGRDKLGRMLAFLFTWQNTIVVPLVLATGYIGFAQYAGYLYRPLATDTRLQGIVAAALATLTVALLYRRIEGIARISRILGVIAIGTLLAIVAAALPHLNVQSAFHLEQHEAVWPAILAGLGPALVITLYDYFGYGTACMIGDEVKTPARTLPLAVLCSIAIVAVLYITLQISILGVIHWQELLPATPGGSSPDAASYVGSLAVERTWGTIAAGLVTCAILLTAFGSTFGNLLAASRVPYAAANDGVFLKPFGLLHPTGRFPHVSLLFVGLLAIPFCFMPLGDVIAFLTAAGILIQAVGQILALFVLRAKGEVSPYRMWLYPLPATVAFLAWLWILGSAGWTAILFGTGVLTLGIIVYLISAKRQSAWPFFAKVTAGLFAGALLWSSPVTAAQSAGSAPAWGHSAIVTAANGDQQFLVDGQPFFVWGASFFYPRLPRDRWKDSLDRIKALGFNTIDLYVPWNWHEPSDGDFDFDGHTNPRRDLRELVRLLGQYDFKVIVRPGPVIRNEWRNGGYPAWLLERPEYDMAQHERLEGRYPATATLQNAHSDDAAAEWLSNATHLRYSARWLTAALHEFAPIAGRVIAVQLDDDQAAYLDNQTFPAPNLHAYLAWLQTTVQKATSARVPVYINTYQPKVPGSLPVWQWGNWYQGGTYQLGRHDLNDLTFSTLLLQTQRYGPVVQSEFQAGWLAAPEDQQPRPSAPSSTTLALYQLIALGVKGIVDFPPQDTLAPGGWEAPFTNWFYAWDAALPYDATIWDDRVMSPLAGPSRASKTFAFAHEALIFAGELARAHRVADGAIAYEASAMTGTALNGERLSVAVNATQTALGRCADAGLTCDLVDLRYASIRKLQSYGFVVAHRPPTAENGADPDASTAYESALSAIGPKRVVEQVPTRRRPISGANGLTLLRSGDGAHFLVAVNAADTAAHYHLREQVSTDVAAHDARIFAFNVPLDRLAAGFRETDRLLSTTCAVTRAMGAATPSAQTLRFSAVSGPCDVSLLVEGKRVSRHVGHAVLANRNGFADARGTAGFDYLSPAPNTGLAVGPNLRLAEPRWSSPAGDAVAYTADMLEDGNSALILENAAVRIALDPAAGGRAFFFEDRTTRSNIFNMTGALRDDVAHQLDLSKRDYIAAYTHSYPAGTFNRPYKSEILESGRRAVVRLTYEMPDAFPRGARFEKTLTLEPNAREFSMLERVTFPGDDPSDPQHGVSMSSFSPGAGSPADWITLTAPTGFGTYDPRSKALAIVTWKPSELEGEELKPYRSSVTLLMRYAPNIAATTRYGFYIALNEAEARARFAERTLGVQSASTRVSRR